MHAAVVRVTINDVESAVEMLHSEVVPRASEAPGFVAGYWTRAEDGGNGLSMIVFESEDGARGLAEQIESGGLLSDAVTLDGIEVREVVAHA